MSPQIFKMLQQFNCFYFTVLDSTMDSPDKTDPAGHPDTAHVHRDESTRKRPGGGEQAQFYVEDEDSEGAPPAYQTGT